MRLWLDSRGILFVEDTGCISTSGRFKIDGLTETGVHIFWRPYFEKKIREVGFCDEFVTLANSVPVADSVEGLDTIGLESQVQAADTFEGEDVAALQAQVDVAEQLQSVSEVNIASDIPVQEQGEASELVSPGALWSLLDSGAGAEATQLGAVATLIDSGLGLDVLALGVQVPVTEQGTGLESLEYGSRVTTHILEAGQGIDSVSFYGYWALVDHGSFISTLTLRGQLVISETGVGVERSEIFASCLCKDGGVLSEILIPSALWEFTDRGASAEVLKTQHMVPLQESAVATELISTLGTLALKDSGVGSTTILFSAQQLIREIATGLDIITRYRLDLSAMVTTGLAIVKRHDAGSVIVYQLLKDHFELPPEATVSFVMKRGSTVKRKPAIVSNWETSEVIYILTAEDTEECGIWLGEFEVQWRDVVQTFPINGYILIWVVEDLG